MESWRVARYCDCDARSGCERRAAGGCGCSRSAGCGGYPALLRINLVKASAVVTLAPALCQTIDRSETYESRITGRHAIRSSARDPPACPAAPLSCWRGMGRMDITQELSTARPQLGHYRIDATESTIAFRTRHLFGLGPVHGTLGLRAGTVDITEPLEESVVYAEIDAASFRTGSWQRDRSVRSPRFLDPERYPVLTFTSRHLDSGSQVLSGTLTVRDVSRPVCLRISNVTVSPQSFTALARPGSTGPSST